MIRINSLSGGKTSSYMAVHYPADINMFALVTIHAPATKMNDNEMVKYIEGKINREYNGTAEDDKTLYGIRELEQKLGKEIVWVVGDTFDKLIEKKKALPNKAWRFCTTELKMRPIWDYWYNNIKEKVEMGIGFRYDEKERAEKISNSFKGIVGNKNGRNKWEEIEWRQAVFPLIENKVFNIDVVKWAKSSGILFPEDSNCVGCFWKDPQQLRKNWEENKDKMNWFESKETRSKKWRSDIMYKDIKRIGIQQDFVFGTGSGCQAGFCTD